MLEHFIQLTLGTPWEPPSILPNSWKSVFSLSPLLPFPLPHPPASAATALFCLYTLSYWGHFTLMELSRGTSLVTLSQLASVFLFLRV